MPHGWLALADDRQFPTRLVLWDPHSGTEIPLPCLCPVIQVFLSGDPLASRHWMAIASQPRGLVAHILFFWRPRDTAWSGIRISQSRLSSESGLTPIRISRGVTGVTPHLSRWNFTG
jgi:hypothetical protein